MNAPNADIANIFLLLILNFRKNIIKTEKKKKKVDKNLKVLKIFSEFKLILF